MIKNSSQNFCLQFLLIWHLETSMENGTNMSINQPPFTPITTISALFSFNIKFAFKIYQKVQELIEKNGQNGSRVQILRLDWVDALPW